MPLSDWMTGVGGSLVHTASLLRSRASVAVSGTAEPWGDSWCDQALVTPRDTNSILGAILDLVKKTEQDMIVFTLPMVTNYSNCILCVNQVFRILIDCFSSACALCIGN